MDSPLTDQQLDEIEARTNAVSSGPWTLSEDYSDVLAPDGSQLASYWLTVDGEFIAHARADVPALLAEVRRQRTELAAFETLAPQQCPAGLHADWLVDSEYAHACPWCEVASLRASLATSNSMLNGTAHLAGRLDTRLRTLATAASVPPAAPLGASQGSSVSEVAPESAGAAEGCLGDSGPEVETEAIHTHFGLSYCNYLVLPRTFLQSMPDEWQTPFVALLDRLEAAFRHVPQAERYRVEAATEHIVGEMSDAELRQAGITEDWYRGETAPDGLSSEDLAEWQAAHEDPEGPAYSRDGEELDRHQRVLIPVGDPIPHYDRGRARIEPAAEETHIVADDSSDPEHVDDCPGCEAFTLTGHVVT